MTALVAATARHAHHSSGRDVAVPAHVRRLVETTRRLGGSSGGARLADHPVAIAGLRLQSNLRSPVVR